MLSKLAQWKRAGLITRRSPDRNWDLLMCNNILFEIFYIRRKLSRQLRQKVWMNSQLDYQVL